MQINKQSVFTFWLNLRIYGAVLYSFSRKQYEEIVEAFCLTCLNQFLNGVTLQLVIVGGYTKVIYDKVYFVKIEPNFGQLTLPWHYFILNKNECDFFPR